MRALDKVVAWCARRGVSVVFDNRPAMDSEWAPLLKRITIGRGSPRTRLYMLLHECGHALIDSGQGYLAHFTPESERLDIVAEEIEAWNRGRRLAYRLGLRIDAAAFRRLRKRCLRSYVVWAAERKGWTLQRTKEPV